MDAACTAPRPSLSFSSAPGKRQQRGYALRQRAFFTPKIRPDFGCQSPMSGAGGMCARKVTRRSLLRFSSPPVPGTPPVQSNRVWRQHSCPFFLPTLNS